MPSHVLNGEMRLNEAGDIARRCWEDIPSHFPHAVLDAMVIMPNHVHGIVVIQGNPARWDDDENNPSFVER